jgi:5-methylcytosine-specific restriction endonuclease McrA
MGARNKVLRKPIPKKIREQVYKKYNGHCAYCGCKLEYNDMQVDHVVSVYGNNGSNDIDNLMPACRMCNFYKSTFSIDVFRKHLESLYERLRKPFIYRLALKYGLIEEHKKKIKFYFEKEKENE